MKTPGHLLATSELEDPEEEGSKTLSRLFGATFVYCLGFWATFLLPSRPEARQVYHTFSQESLNSLAIRLHIIEVFGCQ